MVYLPTHIYALAPKKKQKKNNATSLDNGLTKSCKEWATQPLRGAGAY